MNEKKKKERKKQQQLKPHDSSLRERSKSTSAWPPRPKSCRLATVAEASGACSQVVQHFSVFVQRYYRGEKKKKKRNLWNVERLTQQQQKKVLQGGKQLFEAHTHFHGVDAETSLSLSLCIPISLLRLYTFFLALTIGHYILFKKKKVLGVHSACTRTMPGPAIEIHDLWLIATCQARKKDNPQWFLPVFLATSPTRKERSTFGVHIEGSLADFDSER